MLAWIVQILFDSPSRIVSLTVSNAPLNGLLYPLLQRTLYLARGFGFEPNRRKSWYNQWAQKLVADHSAQIIDLFYKIATDANPEGNNTKFRVHEEARACIQDAVNKINTIYMRWVHPVHTTTLSWHLVSYVDVKEAKTLDEYPGYIIVPEADPIRLGSLTVDYQGNKFELRTLYDIIGWIFSVLGNENAQVGATRENYYYPLMMIARVFSAKLISNAKAPDVWMVMWFKQTVNGKKVTRVVLGATLDDPSDIVKEETKEFRKGLLKREEVLIWMDGRLPPEQEQGPSGAIVRQDFGHCAETYPLLFICK